MKRARTKTTILGCPKVPAYVREFVRWLVRAIEVDHNVTIELIDGTLHGLCVPPQQPHHRIYVVVARSEALTLETIAHEFVHYEQWRDYKRITERGVEVRAKALVRRFRKEAA